MEGLRGSFETGPTLLKSETTVFQEVDLMKTRLNVGDTMQGGVGFAYYCHFIKQSVSVESWWILTMNEVTLDLTKQKYRLQLLCRVCYHSWRRSKGLGMH